MPEMCPNITKCDKSLKIVKNRKSLRNEGQMKQDTVSLIVTKFIISAKVARPDFSPFQDG